MKKALLFVLIAIVAVLIVSAWQAISESLRAERTYLAGMTVSLALIEFADTNERWPKSWEELETVVADPWPANAADVKARVTIRFDMNLAEVIDSPESAIQPIGPYYEGYDRFLVHAMQTRHKDSDGSQENP